MAHESSRIEFDQPFIFMFAAYSAGLIIANAMGAKLMAFGPWLLSVGTIAYPLTFVLQDVINERYGMARARVAVKGAAVALICLVVASAIAIRIPDPVRPEMFWSFDDIFGSSPRLVLASILAFMVGGLVDTRMFFELRKRWPSSLLIRKVLSTLVSQAFDTIVFVTIAFGGLMEMSVLLSVAIGQYVVKQLMAVCGVPITYSILGVLKK